MKQKEHLTVKELPVTEQPYEKCERYGAASLSDAELLAVIIRSGSKRERAVDVASRVLTNRKTEQGIVSLCQYTMEELCKINGIGKVKAIQLLCLAEISKRMVKATYGMKIRFSSPEAIANYYMEQMRHLKVEQAVLLFLDTKCQLIRDMELSKGSVNASITAPREIFLNALKYGAVYIILMHNHPSGDPMPSNEDIQTTKRIREAGLIIGIKLMDHIIIGDTTYVSLKEQGYLE
ncbi:RadC family protein [Anaerosporobacter faecicola]|uniref:RadC family protein n=1 Tax=Anaerosporobacter faecicola TaxID=2718714 RepID=UPI001438FC47|nr:DNA repair protein RadC [Anaerosporobacter faecicola]